MSNIMNHIVKFSNCYNNWSNALPIGNGIMGAMAFFEDGVLYLPVNHYEVYYNRTKDVLPEDMLANFQESEESGAEILDFKIRYKGGLWKRNSF